MSINPYYISGFCDGEASFTFSLTRGKSVNLYFAIKLNHDDSLLLEKIQTFFGGIGKIYRVKEVLPGKNPWHTKASVYFRVTRIGELQKIVNHFDQYPLEGQKQDSYIVWRELHRLKRINYYRSAAKSKLLAIAERLRITNNR